MRKIVLITLIITSSLNAFEFGSFIPAITTPSSGTSSLIDNALTTHPLIKNLTSTLGVTPTQAVGGSAALINNAKNNMKPSDFTELTKQVPQTSALLSAAPAGILNTGTLGSQFSFLGMDASMIQKFTPLVLAYLQNGATPAMDKILSTAFAQ